QGVQGQMGLEEAPVLEALHDGSHLGPSDDESTVGPGRDPVERVRKPGRLEDEEADDALGPGRPGLERGGDDDVIRARNDVVPTGRVEVVTPIDAVALRECRGHRGAPYVRGLSRPNEPDLASDALLPAALPVHEHQAARRPEATGRRSA